MLVVGCKENVHRRHINNSRRVFIFLCEKHTFLVVFGQPTTSLEIFGDMQFGM